ncbi:MAG: DUF4178 domain-containing protein [Acidobacteria bacterium]|nr:DUF4178 domain-containing protein [Acidobacteriota bacterium]
MPTLQPSCPSCGAPLSFRPGTIVTVCGSCRSLSARTDRDPALIGKMADLVDTGSPLAVGVEGRFAGRVFGIAGRLQMRHPLGGTWDEWYLAFDDGRWGWLAEAQGHYYLTFQEELRYQVPNFDALQPGGQLNLGEQGQWVVAESSEGAFITAQGELPWRPEIGGVYRFADLSGPHGAFATLDYGEEPPAFFTGRETSLEDLKIRLGGATAVGGPRLKALSLNCPNCGSPLSLHAPDQSLRVACPSCKGLLEASSGRLSFLKSLRQEDPRMWIPLGTEGVLKGIPCTCIGYMRRSCTVEEETYAWGEYLILDKKGGFRWLIESDGHWNLADPVPAGDVPMADWDARGLAFNGTVYRRFQEVKARVDAVVGEFYWKVDQGEKALVTEFVNAPGSLTREVQGHKNKGGEVNWSFATYLDGADVWRGFRLQGEPPRAEGICPNMPNPHRKGMSQMNLWLVAALGILLVLVMGLSVTHRSVPLFSETFDLFERIPSLKAREAPAPRPAPLAAPKAPRPAASDGTPEAVFFAGPFEIKDGRKNLSITMGAPVNNAWLALEGALVSEQTGAVEVFEILTSYYHGVDDGESWSEGGVAETIYLSGLPPGSYMMRLAPQWEEGQRLPPVRAFRLEIRAGVMRWSYVFIALAAILIFPIIQLLRVSSFEGRRWQESMYTQSAGGGD